MKNLLKILFYTNDPVYFNKIQKKLIEIKPFKFDLIHVMTYDQLTDLIHTMDIDILILDIVEQDIIKIKSLNNLLQKIPIIIIGGQENETIFSFETTQFFLKKGSFSDLELFFAINNAIKIKNYEIKIIEYNFILNQADEALYSKSFDSSIRTWNKASENVYGYSAEEVIGKNNIPLYPDISFLKEANDILDSIKSGKSIIQYPSKRLRKDGKIIDVLLSASPIKDNSGNIIAASILSKDITENKKSEQEQAIQYRVSKILNQVDNIEEAGYSISEMICEILEWKRCEIWIINKLSNLLIYNSGWSQQGAFIPLDKFVKESSYHLYEGIHGHIWKSEKPYWIDDIEKDPLIIEKDLLLKFNLKSIIGVPIIFQNKVLGVMLFYNESIQKPDYNFLAMLMTITEQFGIFINRIYIMQQQENLKEQLRANNINLKAQMEFLKEALDLAQEADKAKSVFVSNMSHELRSPLNAIIGFTELMYNDKVGSLSPKQKEFLNEVLTSSRHLLALINLVLDLSRIEANKMEINPEKVNLNQLVNEVVNDFKIPMNEKKILCETNINPNLNDIKIDPVKFKQALYNYLSNAVKFTMDKGHISININPENKDKFRVEVIDTGIGIKETDIPKLFIPFQQLDSGKSKQYQGSGLGLALTKKLIEIQGGEVGVNSTYGKGSTFYFVLPRVDYSEQKYKIIK